MPVKRKLGLIAILSIQTTTAVAGVCEYRLSNLIGNSMATGVAASTTSLALSQTGFAAAGFYLMPHATSGAMMIGSTAAGTSAAGIVGIIAGTGNGLGAAAAIATGPLVTTVAGVSAVAALGLETACYFKDERITDPVMVYTLLQAIVSNAPASQMGFLELDDTIWFRRAGEQGKQEVYQVNNLYIVNGELMYRDWLQNTSLGFVMAAVQAEDAND